MILLHCHAALWPTFAKHLSSLLVFFIPHWFLVVEIASKSQQKPDPPRKMQKKKNSRNKLLGRGFKDLLCSSRSLGKWSNFTCPYFSKPPTSLSCKGHVFFATKGWWTAFFRKLFQGCGVDLLEKIARRQPCHLSTLCVKTQVALEINKENTSRSASYGHDPKETVQAMRKPRAKKWRDDQLTWPECVFVYINLVTLHEM